MITKNDFAITRVALPGLAIVALALFGSSAALAQSGGNFVSTVDNTVCSINSMNGNFTINGVTFTQTPGGTLTATIKLPNSSPGLLVTPSLVTGMYTNTLAGTGNTPDISSRTAAIVVMVTDAQTGYPTMTLTPNQTCVDTSLAGTATCPGDPACKCGVAYDERFQELSVNLATPSGVDLILSTLSAHSFNFTRGNVPGGFHTITLNWYFGCDNGSGTLHTNGPSGCMSTFTPQTAAACAGPGTLTVQQVQNFKQDKQGIGTTGP
jgi:hypothetical protein